MSEADNALIYEKLHAINTLPKAFFVWGILSDAPQRPVQMKATLDRKFPYLTTFSFLNKNNFNQYCRRSLKGVVTDAPEQSSEDELQGSAPRGPGWRLDDTSIQPVAGFLLTRCMLLEVNPEIFMGSRKNSSPLSNFLSIGTLMILSRFVSQKVEDLAEELGKDTTIVDRHLQKMEASGLIDYVVPPLSTPKKKRSVKRSFTKATTLGRNVVKEIIEPMYKALAGRQRHMETVAAHQPDKAVLLKAMAMYADSLGG